MDKYQVMKIKCLSSIIKNNQLRHNYIKQYHYWININKKITKSLNKTIKLIIN